MDVRRAALDRIDEHLVDELHDGRVVARRIHAAGGVGVIDVGKVSRAQAFHARVAHILDGDAGGIESLLDQLGELLLVDEDGFYGRVGLKLDFVQRAQVGRVRDADEQAIAAFEQRNDFVLADQLFVDEADRQLRRVERIGIEQGNAELFGRGDRDLRTVDETLLGEERQNRNFLPGGRIESLARLRFRHDALRDQTTGHARQAGQWRRTH